MNIICVVRINGGGTMSFRIDLLTHIPVSERAGDSLSLELMRPTHVRQIFDLTIQNASYLGVWLPWALKTRRESDTTHFYLGSRRRAQMGVGCDFVITYNHEVVGMISFNSLSPNGTGTVGYWLAEKFQGKGIVSRALQALIRWGFESFKDLHRIEIHCAVGNEKSAAIPKRLGFIHDGNLREATLLGDGTYADAEVYSLLRQEWERRTEV